MGGNKVYETDCWGRQTFRALWQQQANVDVSNVLFQPDGATRHAAYETIALMHGNITGRFISGSGDMNRPLSMFVIIPSALLPVG